MAAGVTQSYFNEKHKSNKLHTPEPHQNPTQAAGKEKTTMDNEKTRIELIEEKEKQIETLKAELKELKKEDQPLLSRINEKPIDKIIYNNKTNGYSICNASGSNGSAWWCLKRLACSLTFVPQILTLNGVPKLQERTTYYCTFKRQKDMKPHEKEFAVQFLNEVIPIYNKYVKMANPTIENTNTHGETFEVELWGEE